MTDMAPSPATKLVVAISSRALFDFEEENRVFEHGDDRAYVELQRQRWTSRATRRGVFAGAQAAGLQPCRAPAREVVLLSRNDPVSGMRVFRFARRTACPACSAACSPRGATRSIFAAAGRAPVLSANETDVRLRCTWFSGGARADRIGTGRRRHPREVRIAFDGDAVLFSDEAERVYQSEGLAAFQRHERQGRPAPPEGTVQSPCWPRCTGCSRLAARPCAYARPWSPPQRAGARARHTHADGLEHRRGRGDVSGRPTQGEFLREFEPDFFFDDQTGHVNSAARHVPAGHVSRALRMRRQRLPK